MEKEEKIINWSLTQLQATVIVQILNSVSQISKVSREIDPAIIDLEKHIDAARGGEEQGVDITAFKAAHSIDGDN